MEILCNKWKEYKDLNNLNHTINEIKTVLEIEYTYYKNIYDKKGKNE